MNNDTENYICGNMNWMRKRRRNQNLHLFQVYFRNCWCHNTLVKYMTHFSLKRQVDSINFLIKLHNTTTKYKAKTAITNLITSFEVTFRCIQGNEIWHLICKWVFWFDDDGMSSKKLENENVIQACILLSFVLRELS